MDRSYDIFEIMPDGGPVWRQVVAGHENAITRLKELAATTKNELRLVHIPTNTVIAALNKPES
jgi:hypothetical protein